MNKKRIGFISAVLFLLLIVGGCIGIYWQLTPAYLSQRVFSQYKRKYPDLSFSLQFLQRKLESQLIIEGGNLVISKNGKPIASIASFNLKTNYLDFFQEESIAQIDLAEVQIFESKNIFIEKELDYLFESLLDIRPLVVSWKGVRFEDRFHLGSGKANTSINQLLEKELIVETQVKSFLNHQLNMTTLNLSASLEQWRRNKELRFKAEVKRDKQEILFKSLLKSSGDFQTHILAKGDLLNGETQLDINRKKISFQDTSFQLSLSQIDTNLSGKLDVSGKWNSNLESQEIKSTMKFVGVKTQWRKNSIEVGGEISDEIKTKINSLSFASKSNQSIGRVSIESILSLDLNNLEFSAFVVSNEKNNGKVLRELEPRKILSSLFNLSDHKKVNVFAQVYYEKYLLGQKIKNAQMTVALDEVRGKKISFNFNLSSKRFFNGHYHREVDQNLPTRCMINFEKSPSTILNAFLPQENFQFLKGDFSGVARCRDEKNFNLQLESKELEVSFIPFNTELKKFIKASRLYKDHLYSKINLSIKDARLNHLKLTNRKYDVSFTSSSPKTNILEVLGVKMQYKLTSENQYSFNKRL